MADGTYERRGPREAELKRFQRLIEAARMVKQTDGPTDKIPKVKS